MLRHVERSIEHEVSSVKLGISLNDNNGGTAAYAAILNMMAAIDLPCSCVQASDMMMEFRL